MEQRKALLVGVAGGTGSGKTTFARALLRALPDGFAIILEHDAYYFGLNGEDPADVDFDDPSSLETSLLSEHLAALRRGAAIEKPVYDFATHERVDFTAVTPAPVVVVEGILVLDDPALRELFDLKLYVDTPADVRLGRRLARDVQDRGRSVESVLSQYHASVRPAHGRFVAPSMAHADLVVPGARGFQSALRIVAAAIQHEVTKLSKDPA